MTQVESTTTAEAPAAAPSTKVVQQRRPMISAGGWHWGTGRRKTAVARVRIRPSKDSKESFLINDRPVDEFFDHLRDRNDVANVLNVTNTAGKLEIRVNIHGGGFTGQAGAVVLGLARALKNYDVSLEPILRDHGLLTRDAREVERKKYGQSGARRRFQFSKR
jgi:small subunit ribosomal protein S9